MSPALYAFPNYALGVSRGVFLTSLKSLPEIHDEFTQTQLRPGAPEINYLRGFELPRCLMIHSACNFFGASTSRADALYILRGSPASPWSRRCGALWSRSASLADFAR
jgi:hypothetical protein